MHLVVLLFKGGGRPKIFSRSLLTKTRNCGLHSHSVFCFLKAPVFLALPQGEGLGVQGTPESAVIQLG